MAKTHIEETLLRNMLSFEGYDVERQEEVVKYFQDTITTRRNLVPLECLEQVDKSYAEQVNVKPRRRSWFCLCE